MKFYTVIVALLLSLTHANADDWKNWYMHNDEDSMFNDEDMEEDLGDMDDPKHPEHMITMMTVQLEGECKPAFIGDDPQDDDGKCTKTFTFDPPLLRDTAIAELTNTAMQDHVTITYRSMIETDEDTLVMETSGLLSPDADGKQEEIKIRIEMWFFHVVPHEPEESRLFFTLTPTTFDLECGSFCTDSSQCNATGSTCTSCHFFHCSSGCFPADSMLQTDRGHVPMEDIRVGDMVKTLDEKNQLVDTPIISFLDRRTQHRGRYLAITTERNQKITLSENHIIFAKIYGQADILSKLAKDVSIDDFLVDGEGRFAKVERIDVQVLDGAYVPLTASGTLLVDGILASCYTNAENHELAHTSFALARAMPSFFLDDSTSQFRDGIRPYAAAVKKLASVFGSLGLIKFTQSEMVGTNVPTSAFGTGIEIHQQVNCEL